MNMIARATTEEGLKIGLDSPIEIGDGRGAERGDRGEKIVIVEVKVEVKVEPTIQVRTNHGQVMQTWPRRQGV